MTNYSLINDSNNTGCCNMRKYDKHELLKKQSTMVEMAIVNTCFIIIQTAILYSKNSSDITLIAVLPIVYSICYIIVLIQQINYSIDTILEDFEDEEEDIYDDMPPLIPLSGPVNESYYDMPELVCSTELNKRFESHDDLPPLIRLSEQKSSNKLPSESYVLSQLKQVVDETNARNLRRRAREAKREN
jgi:hypothetical protein